MEFVDTNVVLYGYDASDPARHERARTLLAELGRSRTGALSVQVLQEFYVNIVSKIAQPLAPADARSRLRAFSQWTVHSPTAADVISAATLGDEHRLSFWDAMIVRSAVALGCRRLWTEDLNSGQVIAGVEVINPFTN